MDKCFLCDGTGEWKKPNNKEEFERLIDIEMDKGYFVNAQMAREKAYKAVGFTIVKCPECNGTGKSK